MGYFRGRHNHCPDYRKAGEQISILKSYENLNCTQTPNQSTSQFVHVESKGSATLFVNPVWAELSLLMTPTKALTLT